MPKTGKMRVAASITCSSRICRAVPQQSLIRACISSLARLKIRSGVRRATNWVLCASFSASCFFSKQSSGPVGSEELNSECAGKPALLSYTSALQFTDEDSCLFSCIKHGKFSAGLAVESGRVSKNVSSVAHRAWASSMVSVRCAPPNGADFDGLVSTIDSGHLGALYGCEAEEAALAG